MAEDKQNLLTIAAFFIAVVVGILLYAANVIGWVYIAPVVLVVFGGWMLALAAMRAGTPQEYARGAFSTAMIGILLVAIGGAWVLFSINWLYSVALILIVFAAAAIAAALKRK